MEETIAQNGAVRGRYRFGGRPIDDGIKRTASNWWTAAAYNITAIVGLGVLGLPHAMVFLSWGGLAVMALACVITYFTLKQLVELHEIDPGKRYMTYQDLGDRAFGAPWGQRIVLPMQMVVEVSLDVLFTIAVGEAMIRILGNCDVHIYVWFAAFGAIQAGLSCVLPDYHSIRWIAVGAAVMSTCYSTIAWISLLSAESQSHHGSPAYKIPHHMPESNFNAHLTHAYLHEADRVFQAFNAIGVIAFAYAAHNVVLDIQTELPSPSEKAMMKAVNFTYLVVALCYFPMAIAVYGRYGNHVSSNVLGFMDRLPRGLVIVTNIMLILHLVGSYQIFAIPVFKFLGEGKTKYKQLAVRIVYIGFTTSLAILFPIFSPLLGFFGGLVIAPTTYILPCVFWLSIDWKLRGWRRFTRAHYINWAFVILGTIIMIFAILGGIGNLTKQRRIYDFYDTFTKNWKFSGFYPHRHCNPTFH